MQFPCTPCNHADPYLLSPINLLYHDYRNFSFKTEYIYIDIILFVKSPLNYPIMDHDMERCLVLQNMPSVTPFIIWLAPRGGKMNQIARCNWLPKRGKMEPSCPLRTTCCIPQAKCPLKLYNKSFKLSKFVRSRWLDIGLILFLRVYGPRLCLSP